MNAGQYRSQSHAWWRDGPAFARYMAALVEGELRALRPGRPLPPSQSRSRSILGCDLVADLGVDSLELMALAAALVDVLRLPSGALLDGLLADTRLAAWTAVASAALERAVESPGDLGFRSSGSSGAPKTCVHGLDTLLQEVAALAALVPGRRRIVSAVPAHHIYGFLFTVLLPQALSVQVVDARDKVAASVLHEAQAGDLVIGHPAFWQAALAGTAAAGVAADVVGVSSTAPCPDVLADALLAAGLARLLQAYGSSETAGVGWRDDARAPYHAFAYWRRQSGDATALWRAMPDGSERRYPLQDSLRWQGEHAFLPAGRIDAAVQVGGVNVFPQAVAALLCSHPGVREAAVRLMRPDEGLRLKAFIVAADDRGESSLTSQLDDWLRERLAPAARPASYSFGPALPRQRNGKLADWVIEGD